MAHTLGFYYHVVVYKDKRDRLFLPSYFGLFVDELARQVDTLYYFAYTSNVLTDEQNYEVKQTNICLVDLGQKKSFPFIVIWGNLLLGKLKSTAISCNSILVRAPSPLAPYFYFCFRKYTKIDYLIVGDYLENIKYQNFGFFKQLAVNLFTYINEYFQNIALKHSGCLVNSAPLKQKYEKINSDIVLVKTTSLTKGDYYYREDTCTNPDDIKLLFVGRIEKAKGLDELVSVFKLLRENNYPVTLHLAGWDTDDARYYFKLLSDCPLTSEAWIYHGFLGNDKLYELHRLSDIFVLPSYHEGFPRVIWEAMANSLPVISTNVGSIPFYLKNGHGAVLIDVGDKKALYDSIVELIENTALRKKIIENSFKLVRDNTLDKQVKILLDYLKI